MNDEKVRFICENSVAVGAEARRRGRKNITTIDNKKRTQRRIQQRTYRQRKQQTSLGLERERQEYYHQIGECQKNIVLQELRSISAFSLLTDLEELCNKLDIFMEADIQSRLKDCKTSWLNDENGILGVPFEARPVDAMSDHLQEEAKCLASRSRNSVFDDQNSKISDKLAKTSDRADGYLPRHTAFYYLQSKALSNTLGQMDSTDPNVLKMTFIEAAFSDSHKHMNIQCLPSQSLRERLSMLPDTSVVNNIVKCIIKGSRCWGHDPLDAASWEMPEALFQTYWYICDEDLLITTNQWRSLHHQPPIKWDSSGSNPSPPQCDC
ncbi:hypothetical protein NQZ79_g273 [Umbelopsis isabellina]|nr:hypothetical protein NQZ79_g273 [Umbelopsis isabellina]